MLMAKIALVFVFLCASLVTKAQSRGLAVIDSMKADLDAYLLSDTVQVKMLFRLADIYKNIDTDSAWRYSAWGLSVAKKNNWQKGIAALYDNQGSLFSNNGDYQRAIEYYRAAQKINRRIGNKKNEIGNVINIGSVYQRQGDNVKALKNSFAALEVARDIGEKRYIALLYGNISDVYLSQESYSEAFHYSLQAYNAYQQLGDPSGIAGAADRIGSVYLARNKPVKAKPYFWESLNNYTKADDRIGQAKAWSHIALLHEANIAVKLKYLMNAQKLFDETNPFHALSITNTGNIGSVYAGIFYKTKDAQSSGKALAYLTRAVQAAEESGDLDNLAFFSAELANLQEFNGRYKDALKNFRRSKILTDSLYSQENKNKIASLRAEHTFHSREQAYRQQQQLSKLKLRQAYLYGALAIVGVSALLLILLTGYRIRHLRLKNELQNRELRNRHKLAESELKAIRCQMNPHFTYNILNSIESYVVEQDPDTAGKLVQKFALLSRLILENSTQSQVPVDSEWKALQLYAELEIIRFGNQFACRFEVDPSIDLTNLLIPPMLVQPLIENAIHHGLRRSAKENREVIISLTYSADSLIFIVSDNGIGIEHTENTGTRLPYKNRSFGLSSIKERIDIFNSMNDDPAAAFEIRSKSLGEGTGTIARLTFPKIFRNTPG